MEESESLKNEYFPIGRKESSVNSSSEDNIDFKIDKTLFQIDFRKIKLDVVIGAGGGGAIIYRGRWKSQVVCVKMFKKTGLFGEDNMENILEFKREISVMGSLSHPNILRWYGCTLKFPMMGIVMDYCDNGDLQECIQMRKILTLKMSIRIIKEIVSGMSYLHDRSIVHRDLKPQNVLLNKYMVVKIMDFGLSRTVSETTAMTKSVGTSYFMAPELVFDNQDQGNYSFPVDVFAFSILVYIVLTKNTKPYGESSGYRCEVKVAQNEDFRPKMTLEEEKPIVEAGYSWILDIMRKGWKSNPEERPTFASIEERFESGGGDVIDDYIDEEEEEEDL